MTEPPARFPGGIAGRRDRQVLRRKRDRITVVAAALVGTAVGCSVPTDHPELVALSPAEAYADVPIVLRVDTRRLRPALRVDTQHGALMPDLGSLRMRFRPQSTGLAEAPTPLEMIDWDASDRYWVRLPAGLAEGPHALELTDPSGATTTLLDAFTGLGLDPEAPRVDVRNLPESGILGAGEPISAEVVADDQPGFLESVSWRLDEGEPTECVPASDPARLATPPLSQITCAFASLAPRLDSSQPTVVPLTLRIAARDIAGHETSREVPLQVGKLPAVDSFTGIFGALGGRQPFSVRGRFFLPGSQAMIGKAPLIGGALTPHDDGTATIAGWTPPHTRAEPVDVEVKSPAGTGRARDRFTYLPPPRPRDIQPPAGPVRGGIRVTVRGNDLRPGTVVISVGASREVRQPLYNVSYDGDSKLVGCIPPGSGTVSVWAYDPVAGDGQLPMAFTFLEPIVGGPEPPPIDPACR